MLKSIKQNNILIKMPFVTGLSIVSYPCERIATFTYPDIKMTLTLQLHLSEPR